jgi:hypothetical protein
MNSASHIAYLEFMGVRLLPISNINPVVFLQEVQSQRMKHDTIDFFATQYFLRQSILIDMVPVHQGIQHRINVQK